MLTQTLPQMGQTGAHPIEKQPTNQKQTDTSKLPLGNATNIIVNSMPKQQPAALVQQQQQQEQQTITQASQMSQKNTNIIADALAQQHKADKGNQY